MELMLDYFPKTIILVNIQICGGQMKKYVTLLIVVFLTLMTISCDKSSSPTSSKSFSLNLKLVDSNDTPLSGYNAVVYPTYDLPSFRNYQNRAETTISFSVPKKAEVKIEIYDYFGKMITTLIDDTLSSGNYSLIWNGNDANTDDGIYKAIYSYTDDEGSVETVSCNLYKYTKYRLGFGDYITDELGEINETNMLIFPYLYFEGELLCTDVSGSYLEDLVFSSETAIKISNNEGVVKTASFNIKNGENNIELNWDEMTTEEKGLDDEIVNNDNIKIESSDLVKDNDDGGFPPLELFIGVYPNPFN